MRKLSNDSKTILKYRYRYSKIFGTLYLASLGLISIVISINVFQNDSYLFSNAFYIPLVTGVLFLMHSFTVKYLQDNIINIFIYFLYFIRNSLTILFLSLNNYHSAIKIYDKANVNHAVILMILETTVVFFALSKINNKIEKKDLIIGIDFSVKLWVFLGAGIIACIGIFAVVPEIRMNYTSILVSSNIAGLRDVIPTEGFKLILYKVFTSLFPVVQILTPLTIIAVIRKKMGNQRIGVLFSFIFAVSPLLIIGTSSAYSLIAAVALMITVTEIYPKYRNTLLITIFSSGMFFIVVFFVSKMASVNSFSLINTLSDFLQAYFPGILNITASFRIPDELATNRVLLNDLIRMLPFAQFILGNNFYELALQNRTVFLFTDALGVPFQIMPSISMAYLYIGYLAPLFSIFCIIVANRYYRNHRQNIFTYGIYILGAIYFAISPIMYNYSNLGSRYFDFLIWIFIISKFVTKKSTDLNKKI